MLRANENEGRQPKFCADSANKPGFYIIYVSYPHGLMILFPIFYGFHIFSPFSSFSGKKKRCQCVAGLVLYLHFPVIVDMHDFLCESHVMTRPDVYSAHEKKATTVLS